MFNNEFIFGVQELPEEGFPVLAEDEDIEEEGAEKDFSRRDSRSL